MAFLAVFLFRELERVHDNIDRVLQKIQLLNVKMSFSFGSFSDFVCSLAYFYLYLFSVVDFAVLLCDKVSPVSIFSCGFRSFNMR